MTQLLVVLDEADHLVAVRCERGVEVLLQLCCRTPLGTLLVAERRAIRRAGLGGLGCARPRRVRQEPDSLVGVGARVDALELDADRSSKGGHRRRIFFEHDVVSLGHGGRHDAAIVVAEGLAARAAQDLSRRRGRALSSRGLGGVLGCQRLVRRAIVVPPRLVVRPRWSSTKVAGGSWGSSSRPSRECGEGGAKQIPRSAVAYPAVVNA